MSEPELPPLPIFPLPAGEPGRTSRQPDEEWSLTSSPDDLLGSSKPTSTRRGRIASVLRRRDRQQPVSLPSTPDDSFSGLYDPIDKSLPLDDIWDTEYQRTSSLRDRDWPPVSTLEAPKQPSLLRRKIVAGTMAAGLALSSLVGYKLLSGEHSSRPVNSGADKTEQPVKNMPTPNQDTTVQSELVQLEKEVLVQPSINLSQEVIDKIGDKNPDPAFRASSLTLFGLTADNLILQGTGGLIEQGGVLEISTIEHIATESAKLGVANLYANIPGVGIIQLEKPATPTNETSDKISIYTLTDKQQKLLRLKTEQGDIEPLTVENVTPTPGDKFIIDDPETGKEIEVSFLNFDRASFANFLDPAVGEGEFVVTMYGDDKLYAGREVTSFEVITLEQRLKASANIGQIDLICQGSSGSPLKLAGKPTVMVGALGGAMPLIAKPDGRECGEIISVRLANTP